MSNIAIEFNNVGKMYRLGRVGTGTLSHDLNRWWTMNVLRKEDPYLRIGETNDRSKKGHSDYVWALRDISFKVEQGDVVGIIGKNGAGKSTLLKLLSRITSPSTGSIRYQGRIASLLEVGTGFHPEMTGRENIYMNGSIMGMTKKEITRKLDEIVDFAGVERYLDTPVKRYSSGMTVRLGFAVAAFLEPEILVVDEVLTVGDAEFQKKAIGKMNDVAKGEGRTVLFVSHNMAAVKNLCTRGVVLQNGMLAYDGSTDEAVNYYLQNNTHLEHGLITDHIDELASYVTVDKIEINGTPYTDSTITNNQDYLDVLFEGSTTEPFKANVQLKFFNMNEVAMATFSEGAYKGVAEEVPVGHFSLHRRIRLPRYMSKGDYVLEFEVNTRARGDISRTLWAKRCATIHVEGGMEQFGHPLSARWEGFLGLESA
ncbi:MAG: ABC transporter ATP-binding protein [Bacteroidaceae bacterium]|nr:ABC transporter ATP-binding protein [Prevotellaceae bacterium]MDY5761446.1 ABC transporter ATP-binding protein [Bacteroidaceae bacterium]